MRWTRVAPIAVCTFALGAVAFISACSTATSKGAAPTAMTQEQKIERGRYISLIGGCNDCHTPGTLYGAMDTTRRLSGTELGWRGPWGVTFPRNLTPDVETGIGSWTEEQIVVAIREGRRPDGSPLLPPMPWPMYAHLTDEDAYALAAYLKSLPPVTHHNLKQVRPDEKWDGGALTFPPPPAWDAQNLPPPPAGAAPGPHGS